MKRIEVSLRDLWDNNKQINVQIMEVPRIRREKERV